MDAKVIVEVTCPYCHSKIMMKKKVGLSSMTINAPKMIVVKNLISYLILTKIPKPINSFMSPRIEARKKQFIKINQTRKKTNLIFKGEKPYMVKINTKHQIIITTI